MAFPNGTAPDPNDTAQESLFKINALLQTIADSGGGGGGGAPTNAEYVVMALNATLTQERVVAGEAGVIDITDGGAGGNVTFGVSTNGITFAKMQQITSDRLLGRDTAGAGNIEEIALNSTLAFDGAGNLQRAALTGDVTAGAGSNATTIANEAVTYAKMQNISAASRLLGRGSAAGAGDVEEISLGAGLSMAGTTLSASGGTAQTNYFGDGSDGDVTISGNTTLTRSMFYNNLTIDAGFTLTTAGYRVFVKGTLTVNGTIGWGGGNGGNASGATGGSAPGGLTATDLGGAAAGQVGRTGDLDAGTAGAAGTAQTGMGGNGGNGGLGGTGSNGAGGAGANGGTEVVRRMNVVELHWLRDGGSLLTGGSGGASGGAGGGDGTNNGGGSGAGGTGGGCVQILANTIVVDAAGTITAKGGNGGNGGVPPAGNCGGGAGGGGGGGGGLLLVYASLTNNGTITNAGGSLGTGAAASGTGTAGANGTAGATGQRIEYNVTTGAYV